MFKTFNLIKELRWYDFPNYVLNHLVVGHYTQRHANLSYAITPRQKLDLYVPYQSRQDRALILFVHGGSWQHGSKDDYKFLAQSFAKSGFYVACMNYQLAPEHQYPVFVEDVIAATNWLMDEVQAQHYGYRADQIILLGHSAGAFNVMAALYHPDFAEPIKNIQNIRTIIGIAGPYSFEHRGDPLAEYAFAQDVPPEQIMPDHFVFKNHIRHLLLMASNDHLVADSNTEKMAAALKQVGNQVSVQYIPYTTHVSIIATVAVGLNRLFQTKLRILEFIAEDEED